MLVGMSRATLVLVALTAATEVLSHHVVDGHYAPHHTLGQLLTPHDSEEEYIRHIHSMINAYRSEVPGGRGRLVIETDSTVDTKYKTWKRNADLINSLLALPKGMNDAGR